MDISFEKLRNIKVVLSFFNSEFLLLKYVILPGDNVFDFAFVIVCCFCFDLAKLKNFDLYFFAVFGMKLCQKASLFICSFFLL